jgi:hypothetical protein
VRVLHRWVQTPPIIAIVVVFTAAALVLDVLDVLEISHQVGNSRIGFAVLAGGIAAIRVAAIVGSGYLYRTATT